MTSLFAEPTERSARLREPLFDEAFRTLRASLLLRLRGGSQSLLVTGARPDEGKSTVAANLACSLASTRPVALIDADLRRPRQQELFDLPGDPGLADVLGGSVPLDRCLHRISGSLSVLTSGSKLRDPIALLEPRRFEAVLALLQKEFSLVVIDSPPALAVADAVLIGPQVNGVLVVLRWGEVTVDEARLVRRRLESTGSTLIGCVLTQSPGAAYSDYHPYVTPYADSAVGVLERDPCC